MSPLPPINSSSQKDAAVWLARLGYVIPLQREGSLNLTMTDLGGRGNKYELKSSIKPVPVMSWHPPEGLPFKNTHVHIGPQGEPRDQGLLPGRNKKERGLPWWSSGWVRLPMQGTQVRSLVWEDCTCYGATKSVHHNYWTCALEPGSCNSWAHVLQLSKPRHLQPELCKEKLPQWEAHTLQWRVAPTYCN